VYLGENDASQGKIWFFNLRREEKVEHIFESAPAAVPSSEAEAHASGPSYEAYQILRLGFAVAPIVAGLDKFFHLLVDWDKYLPPFINNLTGGHGHELMLAVGVIEIAAGLGVAFKPKVFAYVVAAWLLFIVVNLLLIPGYFDVALRDFGLALGAFALARLSQKFDRG
jgi:uncharacterized membrane protein YphA (DoxX/SURF4 family)